MSGQQCHPPSQGPNQGNGRLIARTIDCGWPHNRPGEVFSLGSQEPFALPLARRIARKMGFPCGKRRDMHKAPYAFLAACPDERPCAPHIDAKKILPIKPGDAAAAMDDGLRTPAEPLKRILVLEMTVDHLARLKAKPSQLVRIPDETLPGYALECQAPCDVPADEAGCAGDCHRLVHHAVSMNVRASMTGSNPKLSSRAFAPPCL